MEIPTHAVDRVHAGPGHGVGQKSTPRPRIDVIGIFWLSLGHAGGRDRKEVRGQNGAEKGESFRVHGVSPSSLNSAFGFSNTIVSVPGPTLSVIAVNAKTRLPASNRSIIPGYMDPATSPQLEKRASTV